MSERKLPAWLGMTAPPDPVEIYVLAGQSNMSGRGDPAGLSASERVADPGIRLYGNDGQWRTAVDPLDDASRQIDAVSADRRAAVGPGLFFARALSRLGAPVIANAMREGGLIDRAVAAGQQPGDVVRLVRRTGGESRRAPGGDETAKTVIVR